MKTAIVVVGAHRSGTSAMTRVVALNGAVLPSNLMPVQADNATGFWEPTDIAALSDELLGAIDSAWDDVFVGVQPHYTSNVEGAWLDKAAALIEANFDGRSPIVLKDPRISVLAPFWRRALETAGYDARYAVMVRHPLEAGASLMARNAFSRERALLIWASYMLAAERDTRAAPRVFIAYDALLRDWRAAVDTLEAGLEISLPRRTAQASVEVDRFLKTELRHHSFNGQLDERSAVWPPVKRLYAWFLKAAAGEPGDPAALEQISSELRGLNSLFGPVLAEMRLDAADALAMGEAARARLEADLAGLNAQIARLASEGEAYRRGAEAAEQTLHAASQDYNHRLDALGAQVIKLEGVRDDLEQRHFGEVADLQAGAEDLRGRMEAAVAERETLHAETVRLQSMLQTLQDKAQTAETERDELEAERGRLQAALQTFRDATETAETERDALDAERMRLQAALQTFRDTAETAEAERDALDAERTRLQEALQTLRDTAETAKTDRDALEAERGRLQAALQTLRDEAETAEAERDSLDAERTRLQAALQALGDAAETAETERDALDAERRALHESLQALRDEAETAEAERDALDAERGRLQAVLQAVRDAAETAEAERDALDVERAALQEVLRAVRDEAETAEAAQRRAEIERDDARRRLQEDAAGFRATIQARDGEIDRLASDADAGAAKLAQLGDQLRIIRVAHAQALADLEDELAASQSHAADLQARTEDVSALEAQLEGSRRKVAEVETSRTVAIQEVLVVRRQLQDTRAAYARALADANARERTEAFSLESKLRDQEARITELTRHTRALEESCADFTRSTSWRITAPLRAVSAGLHGRPTPGAAGTGAAGTGVAGNGGLVAALERFAAAAYRTAPLTAAQKRALVRVALALIPFGVAPERLAYWREHLLKREAEARAARDVRSD